MINRSSYFLGLAGYETPPVPENEVSYAETQRRNAYYKATFDDQDRVSSIEKQLHKEPVRVPVEGLDMLPKRQGTDRVFSFVEAPDRVTIGAEISIEDTEPLMAYLLLATNEKGEVTAAKKVTKKPFFRHAYTYWDDGKLKEWRHSEHGAPEEVSRFDRSGKPV